MDTFYNLSQHWNAYSETWFMIQQNNILINSRNIHRKCSEKFRNIHSKIPMLESLFKKKSLIKKRLQHRCSESVFYCEFCDIFKNNIFHSLSASGGCMRSWSNVQNCDFFQLDISTVRYYHCINFISTM